MPEAVSEFAAGEEGPGVAMESQPTEFAAIELRITGRCCREDLKIDPAETTVGELADKSPIVRKFVELRTPAPEKGQEPFAGATSRSDMFTLHAGRPRGVTWHDRETGSPGCWASACIAKATGVMPTTSAQASTSAANCCPAPLTTRR